VVEQKPEIVSFHFGLLDPGCLRGEGGFGAIATSSATIVKGRSGGENGADAISRAALSRPTAACS
jgi:hypothetical protein